MKKLFLKSLALVMMLMMSVSMWATVYNDTQLNLDAGETAGQDLKLTICKSSETVTHVVATSSTSVFTGTFEIFFQNPGGGTNPSFSEWNITDHEMSADITWDSYPTSPAQLRFVVRRSQANGGSDIMGGTATTIDMSASCGPADEEAPVMSSASLVSKTMTSVTIAVDATDNVGVAKYHVVETANGIDVQLTPAAGNIVVEGLTQGTAYSFVITALDAAGNESANSKTVDVTTDAPIAPYASGKGFGTFQGRVDLYSWDGDYAGSVACGQVDLYVVTWGDDLLYMAKGVEKNFEDGTDWKCQLRTRKLDLSGGIREFWGKRVVNGSTRIAEYGNTYNNHKGLAGYGDQFKMWSYMAMAGCGARTMQTLTYTRDYINAPTSDDVAPVLASASAAANGDNMVVTLSEVTSEEVFYMIKDEEHNKMYISLLPTFTLPKDGSGVTYTYSCYAVDFNGNMSEAKEVEVAMPFNPTTNLALNKTVYKSSQANDNDMIAANGNDGKTGTRWSSGSVAAATDAWWAVDLGADYMLSEIKINWEGACAHEFVIAGSSDKPSNFADDAEYETVIYSKLTGTTGAGVNTYTPAGHARYIRIKANKLANNGWGMSFWEFEVYATGIFDPNAGVDDQAPVLNTVTVFENLHNQITLSVDATDNVGVATYKVKDAAKGIDKTCVPEDGKIVVDGLTRETSYIFTVTAKDAAGNESNAITMDPIVTPQDPNIPYVAAPAVTTANREIRPIYTDAVPSILEHGFNKRTWVATPYEDRVIMVEGKADNHILYDMRAYAETCWGVDGDGAEGIIAKEGYNDGTHKGIDASSMEYLHIDIWSNVAQPNAYINLCDGKLGNTPHEGNGWQSFDLPLSGYTYNAGDKGSISNIRWMKFPGYNASSYIAIDNVYFWKTTAAQYDIAAVASPAEGGAVAVKLNGVEVSRVEEGSTVVFSATANPHFQFVNWSDGSEDAEHTVEVTEDITLTATFARAEYAISAATSNSTMGSATVNEGANVVAVGGTATFVATPASEDYVFVNWTDAESNVVSTEATYVVNAVAADLALTANFDYVRDAYCHYAITSNNGKKLYLTMGETETAGVYQIKFEGSEEATITAINNANYTINWVRTEIESAAAPKQEGQDVVFNLASGRWQLSTEGYGAAWINFSIAAGHTWQDIYPWNASIFFATDKGEQGYTLPNIGELRYHIDWTASCSDDEAPVLEAPMASALNETDIRLTMSAIDNWNGLITYVISRDGAEDIVLANKASGESFTYDVTGLASDATYTFSIVAKDAADNACVAQTCSATLSAAGDTEAPTDVTVSAKPLTDTSVELTLFANDDYDGDVTYIISREGAADVEASAVRGTTTTKLIDGLAAGTAYTFSIVAKDAAGNEASAVEATVTTFSGNLALNKPAVAGGDALAIASANNNNLGDRWASGGGDMAKNWWAVNLGGVYDVKNIRISFENACPTNYDLMASNDGVNFTLIQNYTTEPTHNANASLAWNEYPVNVEARWLKIVAHATTFNNAYGMSIWEFQAYGTPAVDAAAPVVTAPIVATGVSSTSVLVKATATDNFCGELTYHFFLNGEEKGTAAKAYGEEATFVIDELTKGETYTFGVRAEDEGGNLSEMVTATAGPVVDETAPVIVSAVEGVVTYESAELLLTATDNTEGELTFIVSLNGEVIATEEGMHNVQKSIVISDLNYLTEYHFFVVVKDASDNECDAQEVVVSTIAPFWPLEAAPVPAQAAMAVMSVYSNHYETIITNDFNKKTWCNIDAEERAIAGDNFMFYSVNSSNTRETAWGNNADNGEALLAKEGYTDGEHNGMNVSDMDFLHVDIWSQVAAEGVQIRLCDAIFATVNLDGNGWNSFDLPLSGFTFGNAENNISNVRWMKFTHVGSTAQDVRHFAIDNVYFYKKFETVREGLVVDRMYTYCPSKNVKEMSGVEFYVPEYFDGFYVNLMKVNELTAGYGYIMIPTAAEAMVRFGAESVSEAVDASAATHGMQGYLGDGQLNIDNSDDNIIIKNNHLYTAYNNYLTAGKAYIRLDIVKTLQKDTQNTAPRRRVGFANNTTTGYEMFEVTEEAQKLMINGQLFIIRGGKMYNVNGELVK